MARFKTRPLKRSGDGGANLLIMSGSIHPSPHKKGTTEVVPFCGDGGAKEITNNQVQSTHSTKKGTTEVVPFLWRWRG
ncbi:MAG: hypothetical protein IJ610_05240, partial [Bacteroidaceae bacterium]|nr:hypothetical protein [Bacteroidaceae bacterium]